jgi:2-desacetyl-2-hydroxyethyl bacteriochlorophyllide A dehydrogenase
MKFSVLIAPNKITIMDKETPRLQDGESLIRVRATGLCGTDVMVYHGELKPSIMPITNGHESAGIVERIRSASNRFKPGDSVFFRGSWGCGCCEFCNTGRAQLCKNRKMLGVDIDGTMAEYVVIPISQLFHLSDNVSFIEAQSLVGVSCALNLTHSISVHLGMNAVIFGPGHNGLIILQLLRHLGFDKIIMVTGHRKNRARLAMELGADIAITYDDPALHDKIYSLIPEGPDIAIEASGSTFAVNQCVHVVRKRGHILVFSIYHKNMDNFLVREFYNKGITVTGVKGAADYYQDAEKLLHRGIVKISPLVTHRYPLEETDKAFRMFSDPDAIRIIVEN